MESKFKQTNKDDYTKRDPPIFVKDISGNEFDVFKRYYEVILNNGFLLRVINECTNLNEPCNLDENVTLGNSDNYLNTKAETIENLNDGIHHATNKVALRYVEKEFNTPSVQLTAVQNIRVYEPIISEPPVVLQVVPCCQCYTNEYSLYRCHHCGQACLEYVQCHHCTVVIYCSKSCLVTANNEYHKYECYGFQRHFWSMENTDHSYLSFRMMLKSMGIAKKPKGQHIFPEINTLESNFSKFSVSNLNRILYKITRNIVYLIEYTRFFHLHPENMYQSYMEVGGMMLRTYCQAQTNAIYLEYPNQADGYGMEVIGNTGKAICPSIATMNHSCLPNCTILVYYDAILVRPIRDIQAGEELTLCYSEVSPFFTVTERHDVTSALHFFSCDCLRCMKEDYFKYAPYKCYTCEKGGLTNYHEEDDCEYATCIICSDNSLFNKHRKMLEMMSRAWQTMDKSNAINNLKLILDLATRIYHNDAPELIKYYAQICDTFFALSDTDFSENNKENLGINYGATKLLFNGNGNTDENQNKTSTKDANAKEEIQGFPNSFLQLECGIALFNILDTIVPAAHKKYLITKIVYFDRIVQKPLYSCVRNPMTDKLLLDWMLQVKLVVTLVTIYVPKWNGKIYELLQKTIRATEQVRYIEPPKKIAKEKGKSTKGKKKKH
ncbi:unnamed protein product [Brassicogethes aeneus]|uniref:SET domain-containing protein n=1 Tax=Brassicogethes aeneus TaxID=1431903 RepID=A0A9P0FCD5_BRAAE|nr:unnamed protein product [Brassicogethes aeneus]